MKTVNHALYNTEKTVKAKSNFFFSLLLTFVLVFSMVPVQAFANPETSTQDVTIEETTTNTLDSDSSDSENPDAENVSNQDSQESDTEKEQHNSTQEPEESTNSNSSEGSQPQDAATSSNDGSDPNEESDSSAESLDEVNDGASFVENDGLNYVVLEGSATNNLQSATNAISNVSDLDPNTANSIASIALNKSTNGSSAVIRNGEQLPSSHENTAVESFYTSWITEDTTNDNNDSNLLLAPSDNTDQTIRYRINYAIKSNQMFDAGDVVITIPSSIVFDRDGNETGTMRFSIPENASVRGEWNYSVQGENVVLTNTRSFNPVTQGYIEIGVEGITPSDIEDLGECINFDSKIEVVCPDDEIIGLTSNTLTGSFDTRSTLSRAIKQQSTNNAVSLVGPESIPESQRIDGVDIYVVVSWYTYSYVDRNSNQPFTLSLTDQLTGNTYNGFILDNQSNLALEDDQVSATRTLFENALRTEESATTTVKAAFPWNGQFVEGQTYKFENTATYTLTEQDSGEVQEKSATSTVSWVASLPKFENPEGHYWVYTYGNSNTDYGIGKETIRPTFDTSTQDVNATSYSPYTNYYGEYPRAFNDLAEGKNAEISYTFSSVGHLLPWTYQAPETTTPGTNPLGMIENYNKKDVTLTTEYTGLTYNNEKLTVGTDYTYTSVDFAIKPTVLEATPVNLDENGNAVFENYADGTVDYTRDTDGSVEIPIITVQALVNGKWVDVASADWTSGSLVVTLADGTTQKSSVVTLPVGTENVRSQLTSNISGIYYYLRVNTTLLADGAMGKAALDGFSQSFNPMGSVQIGTTLSISQDNNKIGNITTKGSDRLLGYTTDQRVTSSKACNWSLGEVNYAENYALLHYSGEVDIKSYITDRELYNKAVEEGDLSSETSGTFYDLLPAGMVPVMDTISLRSGDSIDEAYTVDNYNNSGRTLLVVKANLSPELSTYRENGLDFYQDVLKISFDAKYDLISMSDYGQTVHNVIAYQSGNTSLGSVDGYMGENDNPYGSNNQQTASAFATDKEKEILTDLDPASNSPSFVYAGVSTNVDILQAGSTGLNKHVMVNNDGSWTDAWSSAPDVYEGGVYKYRLSMAGSDAGQTSNVVFYDVLETYTPENDEEYIDESDRWKGTLESVDTSMLESKGIDPVIYYSTVENLTIGEGTGNEVIFNNNAQLGNTEVWQPLTEETDLSSVKAIAIDASKKTDGSNYVLTQDDSLVVYLNMRAPGGEAAIPPSENNAHAYNAVYLSSQISQLGDSYNAAQMYPYTKVGITPYNLSVKKAWNDDGNRDGLRSDSVTVKLYANGSDTGKSISLSEDNSWQGEFSMIPYADEAGNHINYTIREAEVENGTLDGYTADYRQKNDGSITISNVHDPIKISIEGTKTWINEDTKADRPSSIRLNLYADGEFVRSISVTGDPESDTWSYSFGELNKYRDGGIEINYTVTEDSEGLDSYIPSEEGLNVTNNYYPYGDLKVSKDVVDATAAVSDNTYSFTARFYNEITSDDGTVIQSPVEGTYKYNVFTADDDSFLYDGSIGNDGTFELKDNQYAVIYDLPQYITYNISESQQPGFSISSDNAVGTVVPNNEVSAIFTNTYSTSASVNLGARKLLTGHDLNRYQFLHQLTDEDGNVVRTASNAQPDSEVPATETVDMEEQAPITFGALYFDNDDDGITHTYYLTETNSNRPGYTYDDTKYKVEITPHDNGDGTMSCDVAYYDDEDQLITGGSDKNSEVIFSNEYHAEGSFTLQGLKELTGGQLQNNQFSFEIGKVSTNNGKTSFNPIQSATNNADGTIYFDDVTFTQLNAGKTYTYAMHEVAGKDSTLDYDNHWFLVEVSVVDNDDGTLSLQTNYGDESNPLTASCWICDGSGSVNGEDCPSCDGGVIASSGESYIFENAYHNGNLDIEKSVTEGSQDQDATFTFRLSLTNEQGEPLETEELVNNITVEEKVSGNTLAASDITETQNESNPLTDGISAIGDFVMGLFTPTKAYADVLSDTVNGDEGTWHWSLDTNTGELSIGGTGIEIPGRASSSWPWYSSRTSITTVSFEEGSTAGSNLSYMFSSCSKLTDLDLSNFSTANVTRMSSMFSACKALTALDLSNFNTQSVTDMSYMFLGCNALTTLNLSNFNTAKVTNMSSMFYGCSSLTDLNLSSFNTQSVTNMASMFQGCSKLKSVTLGTDFSFRGNNISNTSYQAVLLTPSVPSKNWVLLDENGQPTDNTYTSIELRDNYPTTGVGTYVWDTRVTISFDANGGAGTLPNQTILYDSGNTLITNNGAIYRAGYKFIGWNTKANGKGTSYTDGASIPANTFDDVTEVTLYAQWESVIKIVEVEKGVIEITMPAGYVAHIPDLPAGTLYEVSEYAQEGWSLVDSNNTAGTIAPDQTLLASFTNQYTPGKTNTALVAYKTLDGTSAYLDSNSGFSFTLTDTTEDSPTKGQVLQTKSISDRGVIYFDAITYDTEGTYTYEIREVQGSDSSIAYDSSVIEAKVSVTKGTGGGLVANTTYKKVSNNQTSAESSTPLTFENTTKPGSLAITKSLVGAVSDAALSREFSFKVTIAGVSYSGDYSVGNATYHTDNGIIALHGNETATISNLKPGSTYMVVEDSTSGWSQTGAENTTGTISANTTSTASFENTYSPSGSAQIMAYKKFVDGNLNEHIFTFELFDNLGKSLGTAQSGMPNTNLDKQDVHYGEAPIYFPEISYTTPGDYHYTIKEVIPSSPENGITYDSDPIDVSVSVVDDGIGNLTSTITYSKNGKILSNGAVFTNTSQTYELTLEKVVEDYEALSNAAKTNAQFEFMVDLKNANGDPLQDVSYSVFEQNGDKVSTSRVTDGGTIELSANQYAVLTGIPYGTTYSFVELDRPGWSVDSAQTSNTSGTVTSAQTATFTNTYSANGEAILEAYKVFSGTLTDGQFEFVVLDNNADSSNLGAVIRQATNDSDGNIVFDAITYSTEDSGKTFNYQIREIAGTDENVAYDDHVVDVEVAVNDNGDGTLNCDVTYDGSLNPYTFENFVSFVLAKTGGAGFGIGALAVLCAGAGLVTRRILRRRMNS